jgi:hypothetical protein
VAAPGGEGEGEGGSLAGRPEAEGERGGIFPSPPLSPGVLEGGLFRRLQETPGEDPSDPPLFPPEALGGAPTA